MELRLEVTWSRASFNPIGEESLLVQNRWGKVFDHRQRTWQNHRPRIWYYHRPELWRSHRRQYRQSRRFLGVVLRLLSIYRDGSGQWSKKFSTGSKWQKALIGLRRALRVVENTWISVMEASLSVRVPASIVFLTHHMLMTLSSHRLGYSKQWRRRPRKSTLPILRYLTTSETGKSRASYWASG